MASQELMKSKETCSDTKALLWRVPRYAEVMRHHRQVDAKMFTFEMGEEIGLLSKWKCWLDITGNRQYVGIFAQLTDYPEDVVDVNASIRFQIKDSSSSASYYINHSYTQTVKDKNTQIWGDPEFMMQRDSKLPLAKDGSLEINVIVTMFTDAKLMPLLLTSLVKKYEDIFVKKLCLDLAALREYPTQIMDQVTRIVSKDKVKIPVNRVVLSARSPVFRSMFQAGMEEAENGLVMVDDMNAESLEVLLDFCHEGALKANWNKADVIEGLVYGADKYMLDDLKEFLGKVLHLICTPENCGKLLSLARAFKMQEAEAQLFDYFKRYMVNNLEQVTSFVIDTQKGPAVPNRVE